MTQEQAIPASGQRDVFTAPHDVTLNTGAFREQPEVLKFPGGRNTAQDCYVSSKTQEVRELPSPSLIRAALELSQEMVHRISDARATISSILKGADPRMILIVGECSVYDPRATQEFGERLSEVAKVVGDKLFIVQRAYLEKSRTSLGWTGFVSDPNLDGSCDIEQGILKGRELLLSLASNGLPLAHEAIDPHLVPYFQDVYSWSCLGARTTTSQVHRQVAGSFHSPVGIKNALDGSLHSAVAAVRVASAPSSGIVQTEQGKYLLISRSGNRDAHLVMRGGQVPNYLPHDISQAAELLENLGLNTGLIVDCSHGNSQKQPENQAVVLRSCLQQILKGGSPIRGLMLESSLEGGKQEISLPAAERRYGVSVTDPCLSWEATKELILEAYNALPSAVGGR